MNFKKITAILEWMEETLISYILAGMVIIAFTNAVLRRVFNSGFFWSLETTLLLFLILVLFGMSYAARKSLHIGVDAITNLLPDRSQHIVTIFSGIFSIIYALCMVSASYTVYQKFVSNPILVKAQLEDIPVPIYMVYVLLTVAFSYLSLTLIVMTYEVFTGRRSAITSAHEGAEEEAGIEHDQDKKTI